MMKPRLLVVEDDADFREGLQLLLEDNYDVQVVENGVVGLKSALRQPPDLILLDLNMPEMNGFQACQMLRADKEFDSIPIIIVSGYNSSGDRTRAFELGADDFIGKPFDATELLARIRRKLEAPSKAQKASASKATVLSCGNLKLNVFSQEGWVQGRAIQLSALEFRLLCLLVSSCDHIVSRESIIEKVWDNQNISSRVIDPHIVSLRNKLEGCDHAISSIYGKGYILKPLV